MADTKISLLPVATLPLAGSEVIPIVQGAITKETPVSSITSLVTGQNQRQRLFFQSTQSNAEDLASALEDPWPSVHTFPVTVPPWATRAIVFATLNNMIAVNQAHHVMQIGLGNLSGPPMRIFWKGNGDVSGATTTGAVDRHGEQQIVFHAQFTVTALQGTTVNLRTKGQMTVGGGAVRSGISPIDSVVHTMEIEFFQV